MGFRFRKSVTLAPGVRLNLGLRGASLSLGPRGSSMSISSRGVYGNVGVPGTGLSYRTRLDRPSGSSRRSSTEDRPTRSNVSNPGPSSVQLSLKPTGAVEACDQDGNPLPARFVDVAQQQAPEEFEAFLTAQMDKINALTTDIESLVLEIPEPRYRPTPVALSFDLAQPERESNTVVVPSQPEAPTPPGASLLGRLVPHLQKRQESAYEKASQEHERDMLAWRDAQRAFESENVRIEQRFQQAQKQYTDARRDHDKRVSDLQHEREQKLRTCTSTMSAVFEDALQEIDWPRETLISFHFPGDGTRLLVDVDLPEIEDFPDREATRDGNRLRIKKRSATALRNLYGQHVGAIGLLLCGLAFNRLPSVRQVVISGFSQRIDPKTGHENDDFLYSCLMTRRAFSQINFSNLGNLDTMQTLALGDLRCKMTKTYVFKAITPFAENDLA